MKTLLVFCITAFMAVMVAGCGDESTDMTGSSGALLAPQGNDENGNGFPSGSHFNLNLIGVSKGKTVDMTGSNGHRIFVWLDKMSKIMLQEGDDFRVLDGNATDGPAVFQLPNPDPDNDGVTEYSVYARALGTPGGNATIKLCAEDELGDTYCSSGEVFVREAKKSMARNVSRELLYIYADIGDGFQRYNLFHEDLEDYYWSYDNNGLKLLQLRFYEIETNVEL